MKCLLRKHEATTSLSWSARYARRKCAHFAFHAVYRTSLAKRLHFSCTEGALNWKSTCKCKCFFLAPPVGLEPTTLSVRNIVALLAWSARNAPCFFLLRAPLHLPQAARCSEPVNSGCDANIKQCHLIPCSVEPWFFPYNAINKRFAWCEKSLNNNSVRQLLDGLLAVVLYSGVEQLVAH